jgi:hypothetical protein
VTLLPQKIRRGHTEQTRTKHHDFHNLTPKKCITVEGLAELRSPAELAANCGAKKLRASPKRQEDQGTES